MSVQDGFVLCIHIFVPVYIRRIPIEYLSFIAFPAGKVAVQDCLILCIHIAVGVDIAFFAVSALRDFFQCGRIVRFIIAVYLFIEYF